MDTSLRIKLIEKIFEHLNSLDSLPFAVKDMHFDGFGFPKFPKSLYIQEDDYFFDRLRNGTDEQVLRLAGHYGVTEQTDEQDDESIWEPQKLRVFLSFISKDGEFAEDLKNHLEAIGICSFLSHRDIKPNEEWVGVIERALKSCHALVALMTSEFNQSEWTDQEVGWAYGRGIPVIPVRLGLDPYGFIGKIQAVRVNERIRTPRMSQVLPAIVDALLKDEKCHPIIGKALVNALAESNSWDRTRELYRYVEQIQDWDNDMIEVLENAMDTNVEIYEALLSRNRKSEPLLPHLKKLLDRQKSRQPNLQPLDVNDRASRDIDDLPFE